MAIASVWKRLTLLVVAAFCGGCGLVVDVDPPDPQLDGGARSDFGAFDAGQRDGAMFDDANVDDAASVVDATGVDAAIVDGAPPDLAVPDAASFDAGGPDAGSPPDLGVDAGRCMDDSDCVGDFCNSDGRCESGLCVYDTTIACSPPFVPDCTIRVCDPTARACISVPSPGACDDGVLCTNDVCNVSTGLCSHIANSTVCNDLRDCTVDTCEPLNGCADPVTGCVATPIDARCVLPGMDDVCAPATCVGDEVAAPSGCALAPICTTDICSAAGICTGVPRADVCVRNSDCDDGNPCNGEEICTVEGTTGRCILGTRPCPRGPCVFEPAAPRVAVCLSDIICSP